MFGCISFIQVLKELRLKLDDHSMKCALVGYQDNGWLFWKETWIKLVHCRDEVKFLENEMYSAKTSKINWIERETEKNSEIDFYLDEFSCLNFYLYNSFVDEDDIKNAGIFEYAIRKEIEALERNETWKIVKKPEAVKPITTKWVLAEKEDPVGQTFLKATKPISSPMENELQLRKSEIKTKKSYHQLIDHLMYVML